MVTPLHSWSGRVASLGSTRSLLLCSNSRAAVRVRILFIMRTANKTCSVPWDVELQTNASGFVRAVLVDFQRGGTGNKIFAIAAGIALSEALHLPLFVPRKLSQTMSARGFPCLRTSEALHAIDHSRLDFIRPNMLFGINFQDVGVWGTPEPSPRPHRPKTSAWLELMRRSIRAVAGGFSLAPAPAPDDLVLHFRDLRDGDWRLATSAEKTKDAGLTRSKFRVGSELNRWFYNMDVFNPGSEYYHAAIETHLEIYANAVVWVVCMPHDRDHPTILSLVGRWKSRLRFLTKHGELEICGRVPSCKVPAILDFLWMQEARHIALSPSTFGWWSAFLSVRATTIHYSVLPMFSAWGPTMWCHLMPEDDPRYIFHDPWTRTAWNGGSHTSHSARRRCDVYMRACLSPTHACAENAERAAVARSVLPLDDIDEFVTYVDEGHELDGLTTAELDSAARRHNLTVVNGADRRGALLHTIRASGEAEAVRKEARSFLAEQNRAPRPPFARKATKKRGLS